jgi:hypothetical protein
MAVSYLAFSVPEHEGEIMTQTKTSGHASFSDTRKPLIDQSQHALLFNGAIAERASSVIQCLNERDVQEAVQRCAAESLPMAVVGGGHDLWGRGLADANTVLDLRAISGVSVAANAQSVRVGGGVLAGAVLVALPDDRAVVTGTIRSVGMTGLALGGGYGVLNSRFGLASDNVLSARIVLADGTAVVVNDRENVDLFWAIRGGGSGFGVVTEMTFATHHLPRLLTTNLIVSLDHARAALRVAQDMIDSHPVRLSLFMGFTIGPDGRPILFLSPVWTGDVETGEKLLDDIASLEGWQEFGRRWTTYVASFDSEAEKAFPKGAHYHLRTRTVRRLEDRTIEILVEAAERMIAPGDAIILHDFHGVASSIDPFDTAFPLREDHFVVEIIGNWPAGALKSAAQREWVDVLASDLSTVAMSGGYISLLPPNETDRVKAFYGGSAARLAAMKAQVDPKDLFRAGIGRLAP